jgi:hypothetical protein
MKPRPDFKELLASLNARRVDDLIVGGYAVAFHGAPRYTRDLYILVRADQGNAERLVQALDAFGFGNLGLTPRDFVAPDRVVQLGVPPVRIALLTSIDGVSWEQAWKNRVCGTYGDVPASFIGRDDLLENKRASGRQGALADVEARGG